MSTIPTTTSAGASSFNARAARFRFPVLDYNPDNNFSSLPFADVNENLLQQEFNGNVALSNGSLTFRLRTNDQPHGMFIDDILRAVVVLAGSIHHPKNPGEPEIVRAKELLKGALLLFDQRASKIHGFSASADEKSAMPQPASVMEAMPEEWQAIYERLFDGSLYARREE